MKAVAVPASPRSTRLSLAKQTLSKAEGKTVPAEAAHGQTCRASSTG